MKKGFLGFLMRIKGSDQKCVSNENWFQIRSLKSESKAQAQGDYPGYFKIMRKKPPPFIISNPYSYSIGRYRPMLYIVIL